MIKKILLVYSKFKQLDAFLTWLSYIVQASS